MSSITDALVLQKRISMGLPAHPKASTS